MYHLLPPEDKKSLARDYQFRRVFAALSLFAAAGAILLIAMTPSYFRVSESREAAAADLAAASAKNDPAAENSLSGEISADAAEAALLSPGTSLTVFDAFEKAVADKPADIHISGLFYGTGSAGTIRITGKADTREALLRYDDTLRGEAIFSKVDLPISSFASNRDIDFTIAASGQF